MDEEYDVIVLELSQGMHPQRSSFCKHHAFAYLCYHLPHPFPAPILIEVLHTDRNDYYGGESTSLNLIQLWKKFRGNDKPPAHLGSSRDYNVDMVPKFMMANGTLVRVLIHTDVPVTLLQSCGWKYGLDDNTVDFIGHALALHRDDRYLDEPALDTVKRMKLYAGSLARFQGGSPYIYPLYGLGELPQAFARLSAVYGGTYMLNKPECKVEYDDEGKACGVTSEGETAKCKKWFDPSYLPNKLNLVLVAADLEDPLPMRRIILPQKQLGRRSDELTTISGTSIVPGILDSGVESLLQVCLLCSYSHNVAPKGKFIAFVSTEAEIDHPETELKPGIDLLGPVDEIFFDIYDRYEPVNEPSLDNCFISTSYDATTHFESTVTDVLNMYTMITGKVVDLSVDLSAASAAEE
ncbi:Guanosine nucleotide diphosphate dissociation inhibitor [Hibiscus syriacus]|uniref:Guanosine nucleotide diphosphate dissociation inhibitor n=1 Tax=Hibiscus syriacus TaxID=106335 RepID=A0A6A2Z2B5_HIBSY|nr:Guanosine nucleotide diphosphate dissociation inhibitor [Hibiscus syriacus]